jgi:hypothetical protein
MAIFEDIELTWEGTPYTIRGDDHVMRVLAAVEDHLTFMELERGRASNRIPLAKLSAAYSVVLRYAGCRVSAAEVYKGMWADGQTVAAISEAVSSLLELMLPQSIRADAQVEPAKGEDAPKAKKKSAGKS